MSSRIKRFDLQELLSSMQNRGTAAGRFYAEIRGVSPQTDPYIWNFDRTSTRFKFYLRSHSFGLQARLVHDGNRPLLSNAATTFNINKACKVCHSTTQHEDEKHFLIQCPMYANVREQMLQEIKIELVSRSFMPCWHRFCNSDHHIQTLILLGKQFPDWHKDVPLIFDKHLRSFLLAAIKKRNSCLESNV